MNVVVKLEDDEIHQENTVKITKILGKERTMEVKRIENKSDRLNDRI